MGFIVEDKQDELEPLFDSVSIDCAVLFGSQAKDDVHVDSVSDVDILVARSKILDFDEFFGLLAKLEDVFEEDVDLIDVHTVESDPFIESVLEYGKMIFGARERLKEIIDDNDILDGSGKTELIKKEDIVESEL